MPKEAKGRRLPSLNEVESQKNFVEAKESLENFTKYQVETNGQLFELIPYINQYLEDWKRKEKFTKVEFAIWLTLLVFVFGAMAFPETRSRAALTFPFAYLSLMLIQYQARELTKKFNSPTGALSTEGARILSELGKLHDTWSKKSFYFSIEKAIDTPHQIISIVHQTFLEENTKYEQARIRLGSNEQQIAKLEGDDLNLEQLSDEVSNDAQNLAGL